MQETELKRCGGLALMLALLISGHDSAARAEAPIGKAVEVGPAVMAAGSAGERAIAADGDIFFLDKISTDSAGIGEFVFSDGSKLTVGPSASIVVDEFVAGTQSSFTRLGLNAGKGSFRWISGKSASSAYEIETPQGTLGIRGTTLDFTVDEESVDVMLITGAAQLCQAGNCRALKRSCDSVRVRRGNFLATRQINEAFTGRDLAARAFPFSDDPELLSAPFRIGGDKCLRKLGKRKSLFLRNLIQQQRPLRKLGGIQGGKIKAPAKLKKPGFLRKLRLR